jgi:hypothetical protein
VFGWVRLIALDARSNLASWPASVVAMITASNTGTGSQNILAYIWDHPLHHLPAPIFGGNIKPRYRRIGERQSAACVLFEEHWEVGPRRPITFLFRTPERQMSLPARDRFGSSSAGKSAKLASALHTFVTRSSHGFLGLPKFRTALSSPPIPRFSESVFAHNSEPLPLSAEGDRFVRAGYFAACEGWF